MNGENLIISHLERLEKTCDEIKQSNRESLARINALEVEVSSLKAWKASHKESIVELKTNIAELRPLVYKAISIGLFSATVINALIAYAITKMG